VYNKYKISVDIKSKISVDINLPPSNLPSISSASSPATSFSLLWPPGSHFVISKTLGFFLA